MNRRSFFHAVGLMPVGYELCRRSTQLANHPVRSTLLPASLDTGIPDLDGIAGRIEPGVLLFIAAPLRSGKTTLALTIARHAEHYGRHVVYWGPHINFDARLRSACRTLTVERGSFEVRCTTEPLDLVVQSCPPDLLIIDSIDDYLAWADGVADVHERTLSDACRALHKLGSRADCAVLVTVEVGSLSVNAVGGPWAKTRDLEVLVRVAQRSGRILLAHRPALEERLNEAWEHVTAVVSPRQCRDPGGPRSTLLVHDPETGLYRGLSAREWTGLF